MWNQMIRSGMFNLDNKNINMTDKNQTRSQNTVDFHPRFGSRRNG